MRISVFIIAFALLPHLANAQVFEAENRLLVVPLNAGDFEVIEARGEGPRGIWCAAADFVLSRVAAHSTGDLYVKSARGRSVSGAGRVGIVFTTEKSRLDAPVNSSYSLSVRDPGRRLPIQHAYQFCRDYDFELDNILLRRGEL